LPRQLAKRHRTLLLPSLRELLRCMLTQIVGRVAKLCSRVESMVEEVNVGRQLVSSDLIVGLHVTLKGPFPLVGESELARESEMARAK
jgi:hypothetical protein